MCVLRLHVCRCVSACVYVYLLFRVEYVCVLRCKFVCVLRCKFVCVLCVGARVCSCRRVFVCVGGCLCV